MKVLPPPFLSLDDKLQHLAVSKNSDRNNGGKSHISSVMLPANTK